MLNRGSGKSITYYSALIEHYHDTKQISDEDYISLYAVMNMMLYGWSEEKTLLWIKEKAKKVKQNENRNKKHGS